MATLVLDPYIEDQLQTQRRDSGLDRFDECWDGVYVMAPIANNEHQDIQFGLATSIRLAIGFDGPGRVHAGANVSDRDEDWLQNYRVPDVVVVLPGGAAKDCGTHWCGGPDFAAEIVSPRDRSREKFDFYSSIGVRELLLVDRDPWNVDLYRSTAKKLELVSRSDARTSSTIKSEIVPVSFRLVPGEPRPRIEITHHDGKQRWLV
jgi:Uma2 family endonuclease